MKILLVLAALFCFDLCAHAALPINTEVVKKATVFIYPADASGEVDAKKPDGTRVLVSVPTLDHKGSYLLLLTARHILNPTWLACPIKNSSRIYLRLNLLGYDPVKDVKGTDFVPVDLIDPSGKELYATV